MVVYKSVVSTLLVAFMGTISWFMAKNRHNKPTFIGFGMMNLLQLMALIAIWGW